MGRNSILEQLRQQSIERMRQERVNRLHRERKDRPILLEAEKGDSAIVIPQASAAGASSGGHTISPVVPPPPIDVKIAFNIKGGTELNEDPEQNRYGWEWSAEGVAEGAKLPVTITRDSESSVQNPEIALGPVISWDGLGIASPDEQPTIFSVSGDETGYLTANGYTGAGSAAVIVLSTEFSPLTLTELDFGTVFKNSFREIQLHNFTSAANVQVKNTNHITALESMVINNGNSDLITHGLTLTLNGKFATDGRGLRKFETTSTKFMDLTLNNFVAWKDELYSCDIRINDGTVISGSGNLKFGGNWTGSGYTSGAEVGSINISGLTFGDEPTGTVLLDGLSNAPVSFTWQDGSGGPTNFTTFNMEQLRSAVSIDIAGNADLTTWGVGVSPVTYPYLTSVSLGENTLLENLPNWSNVTAPKLLEVFLNGSGGGSINGFTLGTMLLTMAQAYQVGNLPRFITLGMEGMEIELNDALWQVGYSNFINAGAMAGGVEGGPEWVANPWDGVGEQFTKMHLTLIQACAAVEAGDEAYGNNSGEPFAMELATSVNVEGTEMVCPLGETRFVKDLESGTVHKYYPGGDGPESFLPDIAQFWEEVECP